MIRLHVSDIIIIIIIIIIRHHAASGDLEVFSVKYVKSLHLVRSHISTCKPNIRETCHMTPVKKTILDVYSTSNTGLQANNNKKRVDRKTCKSALGSWKRTPKNNHCISLHPNKAHDMLQHLRIPTPMRRQSLSYSGDVQIWRCEWDFHGTHQFNQAWGRKPQLTQPTNVHAFFLPNTVRSMDL